MYLKLRKVSLALLLSMLCMASFAQKTIQGTVKDNTGEPLIGVSIVSGNTGGTVTDLNGDFTLTNVNDGTILKFSYVGYKKQSIKVGNQTKFNIVMQSDDKTLDELVVVGYGVMKKRDLTGSISSIKSSDLEKVASANAMQAMQAKIPGLDITQSSGQAGGSLNMTLRGTRSLLAQNGPLVLVDGVQYGSTIDINTDDIESMEVLKDASSTAIYGSRGANGVIIITTKHGKAGKTKVNLNVYNSFNSPTSTPTSMYGDTEMNRLIDKANYIADKTSGKWGTSNATAEQVTAGYKLDDGTETYSIYQDKSYTNWGDLILKNSASQNYDLAVSGGNEKTNFNVSLGAMYDNGLMDQDKLSRYNGKVNIDHKINNMFKIGGSLMFSYKNNDKANSGVFAQALKMTTITHAYLSDGSINTTPNPWYAAHSNPLLDMVDGRFQHNIETTRFFGNAYVEFTPFKGLMYRSLFNVDRSDARDGLYQDYESTTRYQSPHTNYISSNKYNTTALTWDNTINYNTNFGGSKSDLTALVGHELLQSVYESTNIFGDAGTTHYYESSFYDLSKIASPTIRNGYTKNSMLSFFSRVNYSYDSKYLATLSLRADGASQLAEGHKWGYFPSAALGWRITEEKFMAGTKSWLDNLKLRLSWGLSGNSAIDAYQTLSTLNSSSIYYNFAGNDVAGKIPSHMGNPDLKWEKTSSFDVGLDFGFLNNRINGSVDMYFSKTNDLLFYKSAPTSSVFPSVISNIGKTKGSGIELQLNTLVISSKNFSWNINWSYSHMSDKITELTGGINKYETGNNNGARIVGERVNTYLDYETYGTWGVGEFANYIASHKFYDSNGNEVAASYPSGYGDPGTLKISDRNNDGKLSADDRKVYNADPKDLFGMNNTFTYKNFSLSVQLMARLGGYIPYAMNNRLDYETANWGGGCTDYWTYTNQNAKFPSPGADKSIYTTYGSSLLYEKADFLKIKDITLSYSLPKAWITKIGLSNARIYGSLKNFITFSHIDNFDPEAGGGFSFPLAKQAVIGINLEF
ncbi:SusC/RagA family TonB-linked outer membrane protein [Segatella paludivivens]|uniref:SusC/RagA family TonB-linked outer membrane protein n=1 Tax=Segatella paludivivens TaxID=185294 RepID=UPI0003A12DDC|nr:TonB-dependent receptor [Segatella paludivivens]